MIYIKYISIYFSFFLFARTILYNSSCDILFKSPLFFIFTKMSSILFIICECSFINKVKNKVKFDSSLFAFK